MRGQRGTNLKSQICHVITEIHGPVIKFNDIYIVITDAISTIYGSATIFTGNVMTAQKVAANIHADTICINCFNAFMGGRRCVVKDKHYSNEAKSPTIRSLVNTGWKSALKAESEDDDRLHLAGITRASKDIFQNRYIGVLDVTMESDDQKTHLYVIFCSLTGLKDLVGGETATFAGIWEGCRECIRVAIGARDERKDINHIIAPVGSSAQCYCSVPSITAVSKFMKDQQEASGNRKSHK